MGLLGDYIDSLPEEARDRLIQAQDWCIAEVVGPGGSRCLVGHAENWHRLATPREWWRRGVTADGGLAARAGIASSPDTACAPELFAFRRARPADLPVYRERIRRWGPGSESRIGSRFDRLCARRGLARAIRLVKRRAARDAASGLSAGLRPRPRGLRHPGPSIVPG